MLLKRIFITILFFGCVPFLNKSIAQSRYSLILKTVPEVQLLVSKFKLEGAYPDSNAITKEAERFMVFVRDNGYLLAEHAKPQWEGNLATVVVHLGNRYTFLQLNRGDVPVTFWQKAGLSSGFLKIQYGNEANLSKILSRLLTVYENNGYPFASLNLDSIRINGEEIYSSLKADAGDLLLWDTLQVAGDVKVSRSFLESYLDVEPGSIYKEELVQAIEQRLNALPFLRSVKKPIVHFRGKKAQITLFLQKQNANQFDGILGLLPDNTTGKMQLTGDLKLHISNAFRRSETLDFNFKGLPQRSKELNLALGLAELFSSPVGIDASFNLYRQDTNFQNISAKLAVKYRLPSGHFAVFISNRSGLPIHSDTLATSIPTVAQVNYVSYGVGLMLNSLNAWAFPTNGGKWELNAEVGRKKIANLPASQSVTFPEKIAQYRIMSTAEYYWPLSARGVVKVNNQTGLLIGKNIFENELYRIGGFNSLKGFDEQSLLASSFSVFNAEYRFLIEQSSYLFAFFNQGLVQTRTINAHRKDTPLGFGTGISLRLKTGVFSLSYALGKAKDNPLNLQGGKIHFGLVTLF